MYCKNHKKEVAIEKCSICKEYYCDDCIEVVENNVICSSCLGKKTKNKSTKPVDTTIINEDYLKNSRKSSPASSIINEQNKIVKDVEDGIKNVSTSDGVDTAVIIEDALRKKRNKIAIKFIIATLFLFNPATIFISGILYIICALDIIKYKKKTEN